MLAMDVTARSRTHEGPLRCPFCHDEVGEADGAARACGSCGAVHHGECAKGGRCAACSRAFAEDPGRPRWLRVWDRSALVVVGLVALLAGVFSAVAVAQAPTEVGLPVGALSLAAILVVTLAIAAFVLPRLGIGVARVMRWVSRA